MATKKTDNGTARDRLEAVLAAYGADPSRWPQSDRKLAPLLATRHLTLSEPLADARALDGALSRASRPAVPAGAAERLIAKVAEERGTLVSFAGHAKGRPQPRQAALGGPIAALSTLAASLVLGLYLGASGQGDWMVTPLLAEESHYDLVAQFDVLDTTVQFFEDDMEP